MTLKVGPFKLKIDDSDLKLFSGRKWALSQSKPGGQFYLKSSDRKYFHRLVVKPKSGKAVDHINGDSLDNRRANLREVSPHENCFNKRKFKGTSRFKGVYWDTAMRCWGSKITFKYQTISLGYFNSEKLASAAYVKKAKELYGDNAGNFIQRKKRDYRHFKARKTK